MITTHPDFDHCGGNAAIKLANPRVLLSCGEADRALIENPEAMLRQRMDRLVARRTTAVDTAVRPYRYRLA